MLNIFVFLWAINFDVVLHFKIMKQCSIDDGNEKLHDNDASSKGAAAYYNANAN